MDEYNETINKYRVERDQKLVSSARNWLSLSGLFWLKAGRNTIGNSESDDIHLVSLDGPACAELVLQDGQTTFHCLKMNGFLVNGEPIREAVLHSDHSEKPDLVETGSKTMMVIERGEHTLLRVWDQQAEAVLNYHGLKYYPIDPAYCMEAAFIPYDPPKTVQTFDAIGTPTETEYSGRVEFEVDGVHCYLDAELDDGELLLNFTDLTGRESSYPGGRYLICPQAQDGAVQLDFNRTNNWPCAYTSYATCPVPPPQNRLAVRIPAGEMRFHD